MDILAALAAAPARKRVGRCKFQRHIDSIGAEVCATAKRLPHIVGTPECPTPWDREHARLDALLDDYWQRGRD